MNYNIIKEDNNKFVVEKPILKKQKLYNAYYPLSENVIKKIILQLNVKYDWNKNCHSISPKMYEELVEFVPLDRILSETDAPYVTPVPFRGQRNEPSHVREVVKKIAEIKNLSEDEVAEQIMQNAENLFNI
jgi:Tat protein secretion system quality control protein TatD with DNase activity